MKNEYYNFFRHPKFVLLFLQSTRSKLLITNNFKGSKILNDYFDTYIKKKQKKKHNLMFSEKIRACFKEKQKLTKTIKKSITCQKKKSFKRSII